MKIKVFFDTIISNILQIQYFVTNSYVLSAHKKDVNTAISTTNNNTVTMDWILDHMGSRGNYPNYKFKSSLSPYENITIDYAVEQIQLIIRHGTRYPVLGGMISINKALQKLNESNNDDLIGWVKSYKNEYLFDRTGQLSGNGQREVYLIGRRFATDYPKFVFSLISNDVVQDFQASTSWSSRTSQSGQAFCMGAFEGLGMLGPAKLMPVPIFTLAQNNDSLIALHKACPRWQKYAKERTHTILQPVYGQYLEPIATRLSGDLGIKVTQEEIKGFYDACMSEVSVHQTVDTFCKLFTRDDIVQLEYTEDLKHYYKYSYGLPDLNDDMACDIGKYILNTIELKVQQKKAAATLKLDIKFGHSETLLPLRTLLGLYKDNTLLSPNSTKEEIENRQFKLSNFGYFGNNIAIQLLSHKVDKTWHIRVLDNQDPIVLPGCQDVVCPMDQFRAYMTTQIQCDFNDFCKI